MINQTYEYRIRLVLDEPKGVSQIAKETGIPTSTVQKYLTGKQTSFVKTEDRKWTLRSDIEWPLFEFIGETEMDDTTKAMVNDPHNKLGEILKAIRHYKDLSVMSAQRADYLQQLAERSVRDI